MVRHRDTRMTVVKEEMSILAGAQKQEAWRTTQDRRVSQGQKEWGRKCGQVFTVISMGKARQAGPAGSGLASLNNYSGLEGRHYLSGTCFGGIRDDGQWLGVWEPDRGGGWGVGPGLVGLHMIDRCTSRQVFSLCGLPWAHMQMGKVTPYPRDSENTACEQL